MKKLILLPLFLLPMVLTAAAPLAPYQHNFFTTNPAPIVEVVAGSNATVQASLIGTHTRRFTVNSTAVGGSGQTNISYLSVTNLDSWMSTNLLNGTNLVGVLTNSTTGNAATASGGWPAQTNISYLGVTNLNAWSATNLVNGTNITGTISTATIPIANVTTPGAIVTNGFSPVMTFSNTVNIAGTNTLNASGTNTMGKLRVGGGSFTSAYAVEVTGDLHTSTAIDAGQQITSDRSIRAASDYYLMWVSRSEMSSPVNGDILLQNSTASGFGSLKFGGTTAAFPALKRVDGSLLLTDGAGTGTTNGLIVTGRIDTTNGLNSYGDVTISGAASDLTVGGYITNSLGIITGGSLTATNGIIQQVNPSFSTNFTCTTNIQTYCVNGTNQLITLPTGVTNVIYRFSMTNGYGSYILTNTIGSIRTAGNTSTKFIGVGDSAWLCDGSMWWPASKSKIVFPTAQYSCSTNIPLTSANVAYPVTFDSVDFNQSQGMALGAGTNGLNSKMWITNSGTYQLSPSVVFAMGTPSHTLRYWFRTNDVNVGNSCTPVKVAANDIVPVTVPFLITVGATALAVEIWAQSDGTGDGLSAAAASGNYPATPSVICPIVKISDPWP